MIRAFAMLAFAAALFAPARAEARGRGRLRLPPEEYVGVFRWHKTKEEAIAAASENEPGLPVMCFVRRADGSADRLYAESLFKQIDIMRASRTGFAAFRVDTRKDEGQELVKRHKIRRDGALLWYDSNGNFVMCIDRPLKTSYITGTVQKWSAALAKFERDVAKSVREARGHLARERYTSALKTLAPVMDLAGPPAEDMREILEAVERRGDTLLAKVDKLDHGRTGRPSLLTAIAEEFRGSSVETRARDMAAASLQQKTGAADRAPAGDTPEMPDPSIEMMLQEIGKDGAKGAGAAGRDTEVNDDRQPDKILAASRQRLSEGSDLAADDDLVGAFMALTEALDLAALALEKKPAHVATRRFVASVAAERYKCFKSLVE